MKSNDVIPNVTNPRDGYFDSLKFVLITLVILGHTLEANLDNQLSLALYNTVYLFHMPLFIFVTGYFSRKYTDRKKQLRSLLMLFETLVVFQMIHNIQMAGTVGGAALIITPRWTMWYLYSVLAWRLFIYITPVKLLNSPLLVLVSSISISLLVGYIQPDFLSLHRTFVFFPFFIMGYYCRLYSIAIKQKLKGISPILGILTFVLVFSVLYYLNISLFPLISGAKPYNFWGQSNFVSLLLRCLHLLIASLLSICVISIVKEFSNSIVRRIGSDTLFFYMIHSLVVLLTRQLFISLDIQFTMISMLLLFLLNYAIVYVLSLLPYSHIILNPISKILKR